MRTLFLSIFFFTCFNLAFVSASSIEYNNLSIEEAILSATESDKDIFVIYTADWCLPCQLLDETVLSDHRVTNILNNDFITVIADFDDDSNKEWFAGFGVKRLPTMSVVGDTGFELDRFEGNSNYEEFIKWLHKNNRQNRMIAAQYSKPIQPIEKSDIAEPKADLTVIQFGAFSSYQNAVKLKDKVEMKLGLNIFVHEDDNSLFKVLYSQNLNQVEHDEIVKKVKLSGLKYFIKT